MKVLVLSPADKTMRNVVRDFMYGCWCRGRRIGGMQMPPLNLLFIATTLREDGQTVELIDASVDFSAYETALSKAKDYGALVLLTSSNSFWLDVKSCREMKEKNPDIKTILFGAHPTFMPEACLSEDSVDFIAMREPEFVIRNLIRALENSGDLAACKGIGYRDSNGMHLNEFQPFIRNMDELPIPDRSFLPKGIDYFNPVVKRMPYTTMQTSRGCPGKCNFCTVPSFFGKRVRVRSADKVLEEIKQICALGFKEVFIRDETFTVHKARNVEICENILKENLDITWICNARVDRIDEEQIVLMKRAGCHLIKFGVESGNQQILDNIRKGITLEQTQKAFTACRKHGMKTHAHVMLGAIGETKQTLEQTIAFVKSIEPSTASFGIFTPYPGTDVFAEVKQHHPDISDGTGADLANLHVVGFFNQYFTSITEQELEKSVRLAYRRFYFRPSYLIKRLLAIQSRDELLRWTIAASNIFSFGLRGQN
jgi:radical SAM superfamily enzyme YgiQ (UPF0313 family)